MKDDCEFDYQDFIDGEDYDEMYNSIANEEYIRKLDDLYTKIKPKSKIKYEEEQSKSLDEARTRVELDSKAINTFCDVIDKDTKLKKIYAIVLLVMLGLQLIATNVIIIFFGAGILYFSDKVFNLYISGSLIEIIGLVLIIVKYLFKDNITNSLKNILINNKSNK